MKLAVKQSESMGQRLSSIEAGRVYERRRSTFVTFFSIVIHLVFYFASPISANHYSDSYPNSDFLIDLQTSSQTCASASKPSSQNAGTSKLNTPHPAKPASTNPKTAATRITSSWPANASAPPPPFAFTATAGKSTTLSSATSRSCRRLIGSLRS